MISVSILNVVALAFGTLFLGQSSSYAGTAGDSTGGLRSEDMRSQEVGTVNLSCLFSYYNGREDSGRIAVAVDFSARQMRSPDEPIFDTRIDFDEIKIEAPGSFDQDGKHYTFKTTISRLDGAYRMVLYKRGEIVWNRSGNCTVIDSLFNQ